MPEDRRHRHLVRRHTAEVGSLQSFRAAWKAIEAADLAPAGPGPPRKLKPVSSDAADSPTTDRSMAEYIQPVNRSSTGTSPGASALSMVLPRGFRFSVFAHLDRSVCIDRSIQTVGVVLKRHLDWPRLHYTPARLPGTGNQYAVYLPGHVVFKTSTRFVARGSPSSEAEVRSCSQRHALR